MVYEARDRVQRGLHYAIVDEVDSILIDEARTPLIISGQAEDHTDDYIAINKLAPLLEPQEGEEDMRTGDGVIKPGDFVVDEKAHTVNLTESGHEKAEALLAQAGLLTEGASLYDPANIALLHHLVTALKAHHLYHRDQQYVVQNGEIIIVDEFTGRLMVGRHHHGLQAVDFLELKGFGVGGAGHAGQLFVEAEVVLERDRSQGLVFGLDAHPLLGLHRLVQALAPAPPDHQAAGEFIDDDDLAVLHHVLLVAV